MPPARDGTCAEMRFRVLGSSYPSKLKPHLRHEGRLDSLVHVVCTDRQLHPSELKPRIPAEDLAILSDSFFYTLPEKAMLAVARRDMTV